MPSDVQLIDSGLLQRTLARAEGSERRRANHNFHASAGENPHRFLNAWVFGSYAAPHRHLLDPKAESFVVLQGELVVWIFDGAGQVTGQHRLGRDGVYGIDLAPGVWHTVACVSQTAVCFEVKPGPYDAATDKEFAPWAPLEGDPATAAYLASLLARL